MKQNAEKPDYRSMNEVQLKYELIQLEKKILDITGNPIDYKHYCPFLDWCRDEAKVEAVEEMMLDRCYILNLLFDIHCTPAEVDSLAKVQQKRHLCMRITNNAIFWQIKYFLCTRKIQ